MQRNQELITACEGHGIPRFLEDSLPSRDSKMRRFCNYFLTLYNQKKLNPFTQFVNTVTLKRVKQNVRLKMQYFTKGIYVNDEKLPHVHGSSKKKLKGDDKKKKGGKAQKIPITDMTNKNKFGADPRKINSSSDLAP